MLGLPMVRRLKTEMVACTSVLMMAFCDDAEVDLGVDSNLFEAEVLGNKQKQKYF